MNKNLILLLLFTTTIGWAQYGYRDSNMIGITVGLNKFNLKTSELETKPGDGWNVGLSMRGNAFNDWDAIYGIQFSEYNFKVITLNQLASERETNYKLSCANITFQLSYKFIQNHLSVEFGPMVQINGKTALDKSDEDNIVKGQPALLAKDLTEVSNFTIYPVVGLTAGVRNVRLNVTYQYGVNNMLGKMEGDLKGNASVLNGNIIFYF